MNDASSRSRRSVRYRAVSKAAALVVAAFPYGLLLLLSLGSGWSFPNLTPDRLDVAAWRHFASDRDDMATAVATSAGIAAVVASLSTVGGLIIGRAVRRSRWGVWRFLVYLPFVVSPVVVGVCLYDLLIRLGLSGTAFGVALLQAVFATGFAAVLFSELWSLRSERMEQVVRSLGGRGLDIWRHAVLPHASGLILVCFVQTGLYSWLDYGLVSVVGGGHVPSVTTKLFGYIREASVNQAAQSALVLLAPTAAGFALTAFAYITGFGRDRDKERTDGYGDTGET